MRKTRGWAKFVRWERQGSKPAFDASEISPGPLSSLWKRAARRFAVSIDYTWPSGRERTGARRNMTTDPYTKVKECDVEWGGLPSSARGMKELLGGEEMEKSQDGSVGRAPHPGIGFGLPAMSCKARNKSCYSRSILPAAWLTTTLRPKSWAKRLTRPGLMSICRAKATAATHRSRPQRAWLGVVDSGLSSPLSPRSPPHLTS